MSHSPHVTESPSPRLRRMLLIVALGGIVGGALFMALSPSHSDGHADGHSDLADLIVLGFWSLIGCAYAWMRWRPRKAYDAVAVRPKAEAFQAKRWALMLLLAGYVGILLTPMTAVEALAVTPATTTIDRLFKAALFLAPCGLTLGVMTSGIYSRAWGAVVDDELTASHRARAFSFGFAVMAVVGAAALLTLFFRPDLGPAALPIVIGLGVAASGVRFALLERSAMTDG